MSLISYHKLKQKAKKMVQFCELDPLLSLKGQDSGNQARAPGKGGRKPNALAHRLRGSPLLGGGRPRWGLLIPGGGNLARNLVLFSAVRQILANIQSAKGPLTTTTPHCAVQTTCALEENNCVSRRLGVNKSPVRTQLRWVFFLDNPL